MTIVKRKEKDDHGICVIIFAKLINPMFINLKKPRNLKTLRGFAHIIFYTNNSSIKKIINKFREEFDVIFKG